MRKVLLQLFLLATLMLISCTTMQETQIANSGFVITWPESFEFKDFDKVQLSDELTMNVYYGNESTSDYDISLYIDYLDLPDDFTEKSYGMPIEYYFATLASSGYYDEFETALNNGIGLTQYRGAIAGVVSIDTQSSLNGNPLDFIRTEIAIMDSTGDNINVIKRSAFFVYYGDLIRISFLYQPYRFREVNAMERAMLSQLGPAIDSMHIWDIYPD